jgi:NitT/TauT family transport system permease protein
MEQTRLGTDLWRSLVDYRLVSVGVVLAAWQVSSLFFSPGILPGLARLLDNLRLVVSEGGRFRLAAHLLPTLARIGLGFGISVIAGTGLGIAMARRRRVERYAMILLLILLAMPAIVWAFVLVSWVGLTDLLVPVTTIVLIVVPYVAINVWEGTRDVDQRLVEMAETFGASRRQYLRDVYVPQLAPYLLSTVRIAFAISWKITLIAEIFGTERGVGFAINYHFTRDASGMIIAWALPVMCLVYLVDRSVRRIERRSLDWRDVTTIERIAERGA